MRKMCFLVVCWLCIASAGAASAPSPYDSRSTVGPDRGWLIIQGGGKLTAEVRDRFIALAGGPSASIVAIPTAMSDQQLDLNRYGMFIARLLGVSHVAVLHTRDRKVADSPTTVEPLKHATGVWLEGGRQWRLADAYLGTAVEREIKELLERGGVVIGGSAGATIQGSFLVRGASPTPFSVPRNPDGDNSIMVSPGHITGFGLLADSAIDQHVDARHREADLDPVIGTHPRLLGIGLYQDGAIVVHANAFFVVSAPVLIHDGRPHGNTRYYKLSPGDAYDLKMRAAAPAITAAQAQQYPMELILDRAELISGPSGTLTEGTGVLQAQGTAPQTARFINVACDTQLYSVGAAAHPARLESPTEITILSRELSSDELRSSKCRIASLGEKPEGIPAVAALPNMSCGPPDPGTGSTHWDSCIGRLEYPGGNIYRGEFHHGVREGFGVLVINARGTSDQDNILFKEPAIYAGEFRDDRLNGRGVMFTQSGKAYDGTYRDNIAQPGVSEKKCTGSSPSRSHCVAEARYSNGNFYRGEFVDGQREGIGMIEINATGASDAVSIKTPMPSIYVGEFKGGRLNGRGMIFMDGAGFYGTFTDNILDKK